MNTYRRTNGGYTILEVMIVLTISTVIFATAVLAYSQQNRRAQFSESVQTFALNIQDLLNDVDTGYYPSDNSFGCTANISGQPNISGSAEQGTNSGCIFVGKAIQFAPTDEPSSFLIHTIVGRRLVEGSTTKSVAKLDDAKTRPLNINDLIEQRRLSADVEVVRVSRAGQTDPAAGVAVITTAGADGAERSGFNTRSNLVIIDGSLDIDKSAFGSNLNNLSSSQISLTGVDICLQEHGFGSGGRQAVVSIGADGQGKLSVEAKVDEPC